MAPDRVRFGLAHQGPTSFSLLHEGAPLVSFTDEGRVACLAPLATHLFDAADVVRWGAPLALFAQGYVLVHASAVRRDDCLLAFTGHGGAGKSTLARALGDRGWERVADDVLWCDSQGRVNTSAEPAMRQWCADVASDASLGAPIDYAALARCLEHAPARWTVLRAVLRVGARRPADAFEITALPAMAALEVLASERLGSHPSPRAWEYQFQVYAGIAEHAACAQLTSPDTLEGLHAGLGELEATLLSRFGSQRTHGR